MYGMVNAEPSGASQANHVALDAGLRDQELKDSFQIGLLLLAGLFVFAPAFAVGAAVDCERVDSSGRQLAGDVVPRSACAVALMEEQDARAGLSRREVGGLKESAIRRFQIDNPSGRRLFSCLRVERARSHRDKRK